MEKKKKGNGLTALLEALLRKLVLGASLASGGLLVLCAAGTLVSPGLLPYVGLACLFFPLFLAATVLCIPVCLLTRRKYVLVPVVALAAVSPLIQSYFPVHLPGGEGGHDEAARELRMIQFNSHYFAGLEKPGAGSNHSFLQLLRRDTFDIICLQESSVGGLKAGILDTFMTNHGYKRLTPSAKRFHTNIIYTRHLCVGIDSIVAPTQKFNRTAAYHLLVGSDTVTVVNAYLESFGLSNPEKERYRDSLGSVQEEMVRKMRPRMQLHGPQIECIMEYVQPRLERGEAVIVSGDFNDSPVSYACRRVRSAMTDVYRTVGWGAGYTFRETAFNCRIDHIFVSQRLRPLKAWVERSVTESDHYPIVATIDLYPRAN